MSIKSEFHYDLDKREIDEGDLEHLKNLGWDLKGEFDIPFLTLDVPFMINVGECLKLPGASIFQVKDKVIELVATNDIKVVYTVEAD